MKYKKELIGGKWIFSILVLIDQSDAQNSQSSLLTCPSLVPVANFTLNKVIK